MTTLNPLNALMIKSYFLSLCITLTLFGFSSQGNSATTGEKLEHANIKAPLTTSQTLAKHIARWEQKVSRNPESAPYNTKLALALYRAGIFGGDLVKIKRAVDHINVALKSSKGKKSHLAPLYLTRASMNLSLHLFTESKNDIDKALALGEDRLKSDGISAEISWNTGDYTNAERLIRKFAMDMPNIQHLGRLAILEHKLGNHQQAKKTFSKARAIKRKASAVASSWLDLQQGITYLEVEEFSQAEVYFRKALATSPSYVIALEHLGEVLASQGKVQEAIVHYEKVIQLSQNPEFKYQLSILYAKTGRLTQAEALATEASIQYKKLLSKFPEAMYQHAASYYLETDHSQQALDLALRNLDLRRNSDSLVLLAQARKALGDTTAAKALIREALHMPPLSNDLCDLSRALEIEADELRELKPKCLVRKS